MKVMLTTKNINNLKERHFRENPEIGFSENDYNGFCIERYLNSTHYAFRHWSFGSCYEYKSFSTLEEVKKYLKDKLKAINNDKIGD